MLFVIVGACCYLSFASSIAVTTNAINIAKDIRGNVESINVDRNLRGDMETLAAEVMKSIEATTGKFFVGVNIYNFSYVN